MSKEYIPKEISWLAFNERVLQEAENTTVPLLERLKFLGIYSNNLSEFFRVRVATLQRLVSLKKKPKKIIEDDPKKIIERVHKTIIKQGKRFDLIYKDILTNLAKHHIYIINEKQLNVEQNDFVLNYFRTNVNTKLMPVMIGEKMIAPYLKNEALYFAIRIVLKNKKIKYALLELPIGLFSRFLLLPKEENKQYVILLDDVIRHGLKEVFYLFDVSSIAAYTIKLTRDAELDIDDDVSESYLKIISKSLQKRKKGNLVRFVYDEKMPADLLQILIKKINLDKDDVILPQGRYHNFKDFINFPKIGHSNLYYNKLASIKPDDIHINESIFPVLRKKDIFLYTPYHSFDHFINFLKEASIDPLVKSIQITLYRLASNSSVIYALTNALRNGKQVTAVVELQARFDEEANIYWSNKLKEEGAKIIYGVPNLKVHSKLCLITRKENNTTTMYASVGTGNFNEETTKMFCDMYLLTSHPQITKEIFNIFEFFKNNYKLCRSKHLIISPFYMRKTFEKMIKNEISHAAKGKEAYIHFKMNNLNDPHIISLLYKASQAGVKVILNVRGVFSLVPGIKDRSDHIESFGIIDRYLEHARVYVFCNGGDRKVFISSADLMERNIDRRVEVTCPIYDKKIQDKIITILELQRLDNVKARILDIDQTNQMRKTTLKNNIQSQYAIHEYLQNSVQ